MILLISPSYLPIKKLCGFIFNLHFNIEDSMNEFRPKILCIDDESDILEYYAEIITQQNFEPILVRNPLEAIEIYRANHSEIALIVCDYQMDQMTGFEVRKALIPINSTVPFVVISAYITREMALSGLELKIVSFHDKPFTQADFTKIIQKEAIPRAESLRESRLLEGIFLEEAQSIIDDIEPLLLSLESDRNNADTLNLLFRAAHTLKGSSGVLDTDIIGKFVHKYEDIISAIRKDSSTFTDEIFEVLLRGYDRIKILISMVPGRHIHKVILAEILKDLEAKASDSKAQTQIDQDQLHANQPGKQVQKTKDFIPVPIGLLDDLASLSGEITVIRNMVNKLIRSLELKFSGEKDIQSLGELFDEMHKINSTIQNRITDLRKVPLGGILKPIARILRDISKETNKKYNFKVEGESLRIDNSLAQACSNSLIHLIRNSADHGIESPEDRRKSGKNDEGLILITCKEERDQAIITVSDDGKGLDINRIKAKALEKNLCSNTQLKEMTESEIMNLIFLPGFSTAAKVTDISGRGVGMDMVKASVEGVGGDIKIKSTLGQGSSFSLHLPIPRSILIINSLLIRTSNRQFAIPQDDILRVLRIAPEEFSQYLLHASEGKVLCWQDQIYPFIHLNEVLKIQETIHREFSPTIDILILKNEQFCYAMQVDNILDIEEIVVKRIHDCFNFEAIFSGATFLGDGQIGLILDAKNIGKIANILHPQKSLKSKNRDHEHLESLQSIHHDDYVLFKINSKAIFGAPLTGVFRLESFEPNAIHQSAGRKIIMYRDTLMPLVTVDNILNFDTEKPPVFDNTKTMSALVIQKNNHYIALQVTELLEIATTEHKLDTKIRDRPEILGNVQIDQKNITIIDLECIKNRHFCDL